MTEPKIPDEKRAAWLRGVIEAAQAELEGRRWQFRNQGDAGWQENCNPGAGFWPNTSEFRAKPQPKFRPLKPAEAAGNIGVVIRGPDGCGVGIRFAGEHCALLSIGVDLPLKQVSYRELCDGYIWLRDGSPCGVREDS